jgi:ferritin-like metal-binding protein YciE
MSRDAIDSLIDDLIALQTHLHGAITRQSGSGALESHWDARELLARLEPRLHANVAALEQALERRGGRSSPVKERLAAMTGAAAGWLDRARVSFEITRDLRDDYGVISLVIVSYGILNAAAAALGDEQTAELAVGHLDELAPLLDDLMIVIPEVVARELDEPEAGEGTPVLA